MSFYTSRFYYHDDLIYLAVRARARERELREICVVTGAASRRSYRDLFVRAEILSRTGGKGI